MDVKRLEDIPLACCACMVLLPCPDMPLFGHCVVQFYFLMLVGIRGPYLAY